MERSCGFQTVTVKDDVTGGEFPVLVMYPSSSPEAADEVGSYGMDVAVNGDIVAGRFPLVAISHGTGGSPFVYRVLAASLARSGYVVILPEHLGNSRRDNSLEGTAKNLMRRPRQLKLAIDFMLGGSSFAESLKAGEVGVVGHSMGGYTALAIAGGRPSAFAHETEDRKPRVVETFPDDRVKAIVLLAPASGWFMAKDALRDVRVPILLMTAEKDQNTRAPHAAIIKDGLPEGTFVEHQIVPNAGHFSFLSPFPADMVDPKFPPSQDPEGFDRVAFQGVLAGEIAGFFGRYL
jgi:predicted dienelactone hydrolase